MSAKASFGMLRTHRIPSQKVSKEKFSMNIETSAAAVNKVTYPFLICGFIISQRQLTLNSIYASDGHKIFLDSAIFFAKLKVTRTN